MKIFNKKETTNSISIKIIFAVFCMSFHYNIYSQDKETTNKTLFGKPVKSSTVNSASNIIRCATVEYEQFLQEKIPNRMTNDQFESWLAPLVKKNKAMRISSESDDVITIPVVVHVIHNGQEVGVAPNITDAQVISQITVLNQDYSTIANPFGVGADTKIRFALALQDPNGNPTNGIDRVSMCQPSWSETEINSTVKPTTIWDPNLYLNMWCVKFSDNSLLGYAQFPDGSGLSGLSVSGGSANTDGVVSNYDAFGSSDFGSNFLINTKNGYNKGRTMSHEVGHWLGLRHIWGDGNGDESANKPDCLASDYCDDTPQVGWEHYNCGTFDTCPLSPGNDMPENYMDYTKDDCMNIFTQNQKERMVTIMNNAPRRKSLKTSTKNLPITLFANDAEVKIEPDFCSVMSPDCVSLPTPVNKKVIIYNRGTSALKSLTLNYTINGGTIQSQAWRGNLAQNEFSNVTLLNTDSNGILNVSIETPNGSLDQRVSNNSDTKTFTPVNYTATNFDFNLQLDFWGTEVTWYLKDGSGAIKYSGGPYKDKPESSLVLPALLTENWTLAKNQCYTFTIFDSQGDGICCDGGNGYYNIKSNDGLITVASGSSYGTIENRHFTTNILGTNEFESSNDIYLYPNPTKGTLNVHVPNNIGLPNNLIISNSAGQIVRRKEVANETDLILNTSSLSNGIYFITVNKEGQTKTLQFIKK